MTKLTGFTCSCGVWTAFNYSGIDLKEGINFKCSACLMEWDLVLDLPENEITADTAEALVRVKM